MPDETMDPFGSCIRCASAERFGHLFCHACAPSEVDADGLHVESLKQDATITVGFGVRLVATARHGEFGAKSAHRRAVVTHEWRNDRNRKEIKVIYTDQDDDYYLEVWVDEATGVVAHRHDGRITDQSIHGKATRQQQANRTATSRRTPEAEMRSGDRVGLTDSVQAVLRRPADDRVGK